MNEQLLKGPEDIIKKSKLKIFYDQNKKIIITIFLLIIIFGISLSFYSDYQKKSKIKISENYINAKILLENNKENDALKTLKEIVFSNDNTYASLSLFMIINENLIKDAIELNALLDHLISNHNYDVEIKNLLIYKKSLLNAETIKESEILDALLPILNSNSLWRINALFLLGDYFISNNEYTKAKEFYAKILAIEGLSDDYYRRASSKLAITLND
jgi:predicted negative regulator of RcsB-dependent stress response